MQRECELCKVVVVGDASWEAHVNGKKHQQLIKKLEGKREKEEKGIFVTGYPPDKKLRLLDIVQSFGNIKEHIFGNDGKYTIIQFEDKLSVEKALAKPLYFQGRRLIVKRRQVRERTNVTIEGKKVPLEYPEVADILASQHSIDDQIQALVTEIEQTNEEIQKQALLCVTLEELFREHFPACSAHPFGSSLTGLAFKGSDIDLYMDLGVMQNDNTDTSDPSSSASAQEELIRKGKRILYRLPEFKNIIAIPKARTPIIKFSHLPTQINCDLNFKNGMGVLNSKLIMYYISLDVRIRPLLMVIKYWAKKNELSGRGGITNYALAMLVLFYLQSLDNPVIPTVTHLQKLCPVKTIVDGWECSFNTDSSLLPPVTNKDSVLQLLLGFFKFYSSFDFGMKVICPFSGKAAMKTYFTNIGGVDLPEEIVKYRTTISNLSALPLRVNTAMCVQDPFELNYTLTGNMGVKAVERFQAYCLLAGKICQSLLEKVEDKGLLKLFDESAKLPPLDAHSNKSVIRGQSLEITIPVSSYFAGIVTNTGETSTEICNLLTTEERIKEGWYTMVFEILKDIFVKILQMEHESDVQNLPVPTENNKIPKLEGQADVRGNVQQANSDNTEVKTLHFKGFYPLWESRKKAHKEFFFPPELPPIEKEQHVSDYMVNIIFKDTKSKEPLVDFVCRFHQKHDPTHILLEFVDCGSQKHALKQMYVFMQTNVPSIIERSIKFRYDQKKNANADTKN